VISTRNSAKAIIIKEQKILLLKKQYEDGLVIYTLPGGTQETGESLEQAVIREAYEEVAAHVSVIDLVNIYEHRRPSRKETNVIKHKVEFAFLCRLEGEYKPAMGTHPDPHQVAVEWIDMHALADLPLYPAKLSEILATFVQPSRKIYLGNVI